MIHLAALILSTVFVLLCAAIVAVIVLASVFWVFNALIELLCTLVQAVAVCLIFPPVWVWEKLKRELRHRRRAAPKVSV